MRLNINLATQPYQDLGRFLRRWVPALGVFVIASIAFAVWTWNLYESGRGLGRQIDQVQEQIQQFDQEKSAATKMLNDTANKETADTSRFLNTLIAKKSFSWTKVFMEMEEIMPERLHVVSMTPELTPNNQLQLLLRVSGDSREKAVELVRRLEKSPSFRSATLRSEAMLPPDQAKGGDTVQFEINAIYVPAVAPQAKPVKKASLQEMAKDEETEPKPTATKAASKGVKP